MCSIIGYVSNSEASGPLVKGLTRMEYRGYDSVGVATSSNSKIEVRKGIGKEVTSTIILNLIQCLDMWVYVIQDGQHMDRSLK